MRLTAHALSSTTSANSWSYLTKSKFASNVSTASGSPISVSAVSDGSQCTPCDTSSGGEHGLYTVRRPLQRDKWSKGGDGFLVTDPRGAENPLVRLQQSEECMYLCVYQYKSLTIVVLIPLSSLVNGEDDVALVKKQLLETASQKIASIEEKLSRGWGGENAYHVSGYRYLIIDGDQNISRASPPTKVTTLSKESLLSLNKLREEVDLEKRRSMLDNPEHEKDFEACIRARNNAWVIAKISRGKELYMVLEKASETLLYAADAVEKFSNRYCEGAFSSD
ncbi:hypothetical protein AXF42_Ash003206 [Apostasia shenzhenica]|uniref:Uncharacterized protein n=1 Tax=Apostasia shenzhenica TaxID=1088818 RepID=A0A2I0BFL3_9ASPA|nr:hypothetical protein AXF42_Ash003206 [Apostasia shenzhenica]